VTVEKPDPLKRPLSDKEKIAQQKALKQELKGVYKKWVDEDVRWINTDQEMQAFKSLGNDEERDQFIENFWLRRNPNPDSPDNEFRESITRESRMRTSILLRASRAGRRTADISTSPSANRTILTPIQAAATTSGRWKRVAATPRPSRLRYGTTGTLKG
jgi:GWxTD domain-containing protein